jgi:hypothetical protein
VFGQVDEAFAACFSVPAAGGFFSAYAFQVAAIAYAPKSGHYE